MEFLSPGHPKQIENPLKVLSSTQICEPDNIIDLTGDTPCMSKHPDLDAMTSTLKRTAEDNTPSPVKRAKQVAELEELVYKDEYGGDSEGLSDSEIIEMQMVALAALQRENRKLLDLFRSQARKRMRFLSEVVKAKGLQMQAQGEFLKNMAQAELDQD